MGASRASRAVLTCPPRSTWRLRSYISSAALPSSAVNRQYWPMGLPSNRAHSCEGRTCFQPYYDHALQVPGALVVGDQMAQCWGSKRLRVGQITGLLDSDIDCERFSNCLNEEESRRLSRVLHFGRGHKPGQEQVAHRGPSDYRNRF